VKDAEGVTPEVDVTAESLNEAIFRKQSWVSIINDREDILVEVQQPTIQHRVNQEKFWTWLQATGIAPRDIYLRKRVRDLLK